MTRSDRLRVAAALAASLLVHVGVVILLRPPPPAALPQGLQLTLLLVPVPGESRAESAQAASPAIPPAAEGSRRATRERKAESASSAASEAQTRRRPWVSAGPISPPAAPPRSQLADAAAYLGPDAIGTPPAFDAPFETQFPRKAFQDGRRGVVVVQLLIDENGRVSEALAMPDAPEDFAAAAVAGLRAARFRPAQAGGRPVKARAYFAVSFVIE